MGRCGVIGTLGKVTKVQALLVLETFYALGGRAVFNLTRYHHQGKF